MKGIVSASGMSRVGSRGDCWTLLFTFEAWRIDNGPLQTSSLTVRREASHEEFESYWELISPDTIISVAAKVALENVYGTPQAYLEKYIGESREDYELNEYLTESRSVTHVG